MDAKEQNAHKFNSLLFPTLVSILNKEHEPQLDILLNVLFSILNKLNKQPYDYIQVNLGM